MARATRSPGRDVRVLDVAMFFGPVLTGATVTMIAPVTLLSLRGDGHLPKWLGFLGVATVIEQAIETLTIFGSTGFTQPGGAMNMQLGAAMVMAWFLAFALWGGIRGLARWLARAGASVTFEPGSRTAWHTHPLGQTLIVTMGCGWVPEWGGPIEEIRPGDVIRCPSGRKHWHGATPTTAMTHVAIQEKLDGKAVEWMEKVTDAQYGK
jgi:hypothetical protein